MPRPRATTDDAILDAARASFLEHGASVPTSVIAARLGISQANLFQRFGTKEQLMRAALLQSGDPPWFAMLRGGPDTRDVREQLAEIATTFVAYFEEMMPRLLVMRSAGFGPRLDDAHVEQSFPARLQREITAWFARAAERGLLAVPHPDHAADLFIGAFQWRTIQTHLQRRSTGTSDTREYVAFAVGAVCHALQLAPVPHASTELAAPPVPSRVSKGPASP